MSRLCFSVQGALVLVLFAPLLVFAADLNEGTTLDLKLLGGVLTVTVTCTLYLGGKLNELKSIGMRLRVGDERFKDHDERIRWLELNCASNHKTQRMEVVE